MGEGGGKCIFWFDRFLPLFTSFLFLLIFFLKKNYYISLIWLECKIKIRKKTRRERLIIINNDQYKQISQTAAAAVNDVHVRRRRWRWRRRWRPQQQPQQLRLVLRGWGNMNVVWLLFPLWRPSTGQNSPSVLSTNKAMKFNLLPSLELNSRLRFNYRSVNDWLHHAVSN